jgi:Na+/H+ antiporter NhaD/arsenite permease-like protein
MNRNLPLIVILGLLSATGLGLASEANATQGGSTPLGEVLPLWSMFPFLGVLLSIAILPLAAPRFWHHHFGKVSLAWSLILAIPFCFGFKGAAVHEIVHIFLADYIPFLILLLGLFTVSGGIYLRGAPAGTPFVNTIFLAIGTILASWMGTTGASMLLIRPVLRANAKRKSKKHIVIFLIFLVCNIGGALTPLGDPPLFLGFLHGVPFFWTMRLLPHMLFISVIVLIVFFIIDSILYRKEGAIAATAESKEPLRLEGAHNLIFLAGIVGAVLLSGMWKGGETTILGVPKAHPDLVRDALILLMALLSWWTTKKEIRSANGFTWFPIKEVAILFAGIFMTILPVLDMLQAGTRGSMAFIIDAAQKPWHYFWMSGALSSFLDNAPTYLTFFNTALGRLGISPNDVTGILNGTIHSPASDQFIGFLKAISAGSVFYGANTYIGNAPNFMVRSIAEENKVPMPSFFGYMLWSIGILLPIFLIATFMFF